MNLKTYKVVDLRI